MHPKLKIIKVVFFIEKVTIMQFGKLKLMNNLSAIKTGTSITFYRQMRTNMTRTIEILKRWVLKRFLWWRKISFRLKIKKTERRLVSGKKQPPGYKGRDTRLTSMIKGWIRVHKLLSLFLTIKILYKISQRYQKQRKFRWITTNIWLKMSRKRSE